MANYESHHLYAQELQKNLMDAGVLEELPEEYRKRSGGCTHRIMYAKCDAADWEEQRQKILEHGVIDCSKKNADGKYGVRRDYTEAEQKELGWYPVWFETPDEMVWISKWVMDDNPGYYASRAVPTQNMIMVLYYEATFDGGWYMKNGKKFADMPSIPTTVNPKDALEAAIDALKAANLNGFVDEMVNRFMMIDKAVDGRSIEQQQFSVVLDYVSFKNPDEPADEYPDEPDDGDHAVDPGEPMEPNPDLPF
jgi:hypothetical protein